MQYHINTGGCPEDRNAILARMSAEAAGVGVGGRRQWMLRVILLSLPLIGLVALEVSARIYYHFRYGVPGHSYGTSKYDPALGAAPRENSYSANAHLNDHAFRNSENVFQPKPDGALRVIAYGGSTTYCHHLNNDEAWPIRLQAALRQQRPGGGRDQVLNGGVIMWSLAHSFERAKRDVPLLRPDAVIIYTGVNERYNATFLAAEGLPMRELVQRGEYGRFTTQLPFNTPFRNVIVYKFARDRVFGPLQLALRREPVIEPVVDPFIMENYLHTMRRFVGYLKDNGVTPIVVKEVFDPANPKARLNEVGTSYSAEAARVAPSWGAVVVDPTAAFHSPEHGGTGLFQNTGVHMTQAGANLMASEIFAQAFRK